MTVGAVRDRQFAARAVIVIEQALVVLQRPKHREDLIIVPVAAAHLGPGVVVGPRAADIDHRIHRAAAAEHVALRHDRWPSVQAVLGFGGIEQRVPALLQNLEEGGGDVDVFVGVALSALDQQDAIGWILRKPRGEHAAGRTAARDDVVELLHQQKNVCTLVNSFSPSTPNSTPKPDCLTPPNGALGWIAPCLLIQTEPASILWTTLRAPSRSLPQTEPPRPMELAFALAITSSTSW